MITNLGAMTTERLKGMWEHISVSSCLTVFNRVAYETVNGKGKFPARIVMFRDGKLPTASSYGVRLQSYFSMQVSPKDNSLLSFAKNCPKFRMRANV